MDGPVPDHRAERAHLGGHVDEFLPAETGVDRHHADQIGQVQQMRHRLGRGAGVQRHARLHPRAPDRLQRAVNMRPRLDMGSQDVGPRFGIGVDVGIDGGDHQMHIHHRCHMAAKGFDRHRAKSQVRHEMPVHHIDMHPVGALILDRADLGPEIGEIGRKDRGRDLDAAVKGHRAGSVKR